MIIAVWGSNGAGKTVITAHLAQLLAEEQTTLAIGGALSHSSLQHCFGFVEKDKSLKEVLLNSATIFDNLISHKNYENLFVLDNGAGEDCLYYDDIVEKQAVSLLGAAEQNFDVTIIDCAISYDNVLTRAAILQADQIIYVLDGRLESNAFYFAHRQLCKRLRLEPKITYLFNKNRKRINTRQLGREIEQEFQGKLPYVRRIEDGMVNGELLGRADVVNRNERRFIKALQKVIDGLNVARGREQ